LANDSERRENVMGAGYDAAAALSLVACAARKRRFRNARRCLFAEL